MIKYGSRKFIALCVQMIFLVVLPILYKKLDISDEALITVLIATSGCCAAYTGFNVLAKKYGDNGPQ